MEVVIRMDEKLAEEILECTRLYASKLHPRVSSAIRPALDELKRRQQRWEEAKKAN